jgi:undecaprenyl diphosphate synthase
MRHVGVIMDGNRRFAKKQGKASNFGHEAGASVIKKVCQFAKDFNIPFLTLFAFSNENWGRNKEEIAFLNKLIKHFLSSEYTHFIENEIKVRIIGDLSPYSKEICEGIEKLQKNTASFDKFTLSIALNYGGREDILQAVNLAIREKRHLNKEEFSKLLYTKDMPDVDLLIRTGGARRLSNFLLWNLAYTELYFTDVLWPEFNEEDFKKAVDFFNSQVRNFGL